jgi:O-antigen ligase
MNNTINYSRTHFFLCFFVCAIPPALVIGAAILEFFIFLSCFFFFFLNYKKIGLDYYKKKIFLYFIFFFIFLVISSITSDYVANSIRNSIFYFRFGILILIVWYLLDSYKKFKFLFFCSLFLTLFVVNFYSFLQLFVLHNYTNVDRISGFFGAEEVQGSFLLRITPIFLIFFFYNKKNLNLFFYYFFYLILMSNLILILLSGERAAIFLMCIGIFFGFIFLKFHLRFFFLISLLIFTIFFLTVVSFPKTKERIFKVTYNQVFLDGDGTKKINLFSKGHEGHFTSAMLMFKKNYFKGVGIRNFRMECQKDIYKEVAGTFHCSTHPHNTYMQFLSETGLMGTLFLISFLLFIFIKSCKFLKGIYIKGAKKNAPMGICLVTILINFFPFVTTGSFFNNWLSTLYLLPVGFLLHEINYKSN